MRYTIFGESHGPAIGVVIEGLPAGIPLDFDLIRMELLRRAPGKNPLSTQRNEKDEPEIHSGLFEGKTTGTPLCAIIRNQDQRSADYTPNLPRPGHGDYSGFVRYGGNNDYRGGGHFSGRLTAPLVFAGAVAKQLLARRGVFVGAHIRQLDTIHDGTFLDMELSPDLLHLLSRREVPAVTAGDAMIARIMAAKGEQDSVGGSIECAVIGLPAGIGAPDFGENVEGEISRAMFAIPGVKGIAFGSGFDCVTMPGSQFNDAFYMDGDVVRTRTNHSGGVNGGITNGMDVVFTVAMRPTPSIGKEQETVDLSKGENASVSIRGRHDPCIVHRAVPVVEAAAALAVCQLLGEELNR